MIKPNEYFDEIYCLNMNKCIDRWNIVNERFKRENIHVKRIEGIDSDLLTEQFKQHRKTSSRIIHLGRYAIWLAFSKLFENILDSPSYIKKFLIFEDDILFHKDFQYLFDIIINKYLPEDWKMWYLGSTQLGHHNINKILYESNFDTYGMFAIAFQRTQLEKYYKDYKKGLLNNDNFWAKAIDKSGVYVSNPKLVGHSYGYSYNAKYSITDSIAEKLPYFKYDKDLYE